MWTEIIIAALGMIGLVLALLRRPRRVRLLPSKLNRAERRRRHRDFERGLWRMQQAARKDGSK